MKNNTNIREITDFKLYTKFSKLYNALDALKEVGTLYDFPVPTINVIGAPSTGKSSIIESLIGFEFLPKATNGQVKTLCPIEIKMVHLSKNKENDYITFDCESDRKYFDFAEAKKKIEKLIESKNGKYFDSAIKLSLFSYCCADMKIIDLPGIINSSPESEKATKSICYKYCNRDNCITILALDATSASTHNQDLSLKFINEIDPTGKQTFSVLTKIDLCDKQTLEEIKTKLTSLEQNKNKSHNTFENPLNSFVILKNKPESQNYSINTIGGESLALFLRKEKDYFRSIISLRSLSLNEHFGYECLVDKLKKALLQIQITGFPKIFEETKSKISDCQDEMQKFGTEYLYLQNDTESSKVSYMNTLVSHFADDIDAKFSGKLTKTKSSSSESSLTNSSLKKLYYEFLQDYKSNHSVNLPSKSVSNEEIIQIIKVNEADGLSGFPQAEVIHLVLEKEVGKLRAKVKEFAEEVINLIVTSVKLCTDSQFCRFPPLLERIEEIVNSFLESNFSKYKYLIDNISEMHFSYFYLDEKSLSYSNLLEKILSADNNVGDTERRNLEADFSKNYYSKLVEYIKFLANYYHSIIIRDLREQIPKVTGEYLIKPIKQNLRFYLMSELKISETAVELLKENSDVKKKREYYINAMKHLKDAEKNLNLDDELKKLLKNDPNHKKACKRSSVDSTNDGDSGHFHNQKHYSSNQEDLSSSRKEQTKPSKPQTYEEEHKSFNDKNGGYAAAAKSAANQNYLNEEEYKNRDNRINTSNSNSLLKDPKSSNTLNNNFNNTNTNNNYNNNYNYNNSNNNLNSNSTNNKNTSNNNLINVNTSLNNKTYANDVKLSSAGNANTTNPLTNNNANNLSSNSGVGSSKNTTNVNFNYDPSTNQIKDVNVKVDMDAETAYKLYQDNKKYLPTTQQVISGAKTSANFVQNSGVLNEIGNNGAAQQQPKKKAGGDPLSSFFGSAFSKSAAGAGSDKSAGNGANAGSKKGMF